MRSRMDASPCDLFWPRMWRVSVEDEGPGLTADQREKIFERFVSFNSNGEATKEVAWAWRSPAVSFDCIARKSSPWKARAVAACVSRSKFQQSAGRYAHMARIRDRWRITARNVMAGVASSDAGAISLHQAHAAGSDSVIPAAAFRKFGRRPRAAASGLFC